MANKDKLKELREKAEKVLKSKGIEKPIDYYENVEQLVEELNIHQIELEMQNQELQETNKRLENEQKRYRELYMNAPVAYFTLNETGNIIELNQTAADLLQIPIQKFKFTSIFPYLEDDSKKEFSKYFKEVFNSSKTQYGELIFKTNNRLIHGNLTAISYFDDELNMKLIRCAVTDSTKTKQYERELQFQKETEEKITNLNLELNSTLDEVNAINEELEKTNNTLEIERRQFLSILDSIPEMIYVSDFETNKILFANKKLRENSTINFTGKLCYNLIQGNEKVCEFCTNKFIKNTEEPYFWEYYNPNLKKHFYIMDRKIKWSDNKEVRFELAIDITKQKEAQKRIEKLNNRLETSMLAGEMAWWEMELPSGAIRFNPNKAIMLGHNPDDFKHYSDFMKLLHPNDYEPAMQVMHKHLNGEQDSYEIEYRIKNINNEYIWFYDIGKITKKENENITLTGIVINITKRKAGELALKEREIQHRLLFQNSVNAILWASTNGIIEKVNKAAGELFECSPQELIGIHQKDLHPEENRIQARKAFDNNVGNEKFSGRFKILTLKGNIKDVNIHATSVPFKNNTLHQGVFVDITEQVKAEQQLKLSEEKFRLLAENTADGLSIIANNRKIEYISPGFYNLLGYTLEELKEFEFAAINEITHPDDKSRILELINSALKQQKEFITYIYRAKHKKGHYIYKNDNVRFTYKNNEFYKAYTVSSDITELKEKELALKKNKQIIEKYNTELQEVNATKDKFFSIVAHDLKSPFNSIIGFSDLLIKNIHKYDKEKIKRFTSSINDASNNAYNLLENLLEWSRSQTGRIAFEPQELIVESILLDSIEQVSAAAKEKNITVDYHVTEALTVFADENMLKTILRNLISNAVKFTYKNGIISISAVQVEKEVHFTVSDTGVGMNSETVSKLFKIEEKISSQGTNNERGTGLGLLLCKEFTEKHGGKIRVESEEGKGSDFTFSLPSAKA